MKIGITGGLGCGKSTALKIFEDLGFKTLDSDILVKQIYAEDQEVRKAIEERFGPSALTPTGVNSSFLAKKVFNAPPSLSWLQNLVHPKVQNLRDFYISKDPNASWAVEIPLLFEKNLENSFDVTICLSAQIDLQLSRLSKKGISPGDAKSRIASQLPLQLKEKRADYVIYNNSSLEDLRTQIYQLAQKLRERFA